MRHLIATLAMLALASVAQAQTLQASSPVFTGTWLATTNGSPSDNTAQIATDAFVQSVMSASAPFAPQLHESQGCQGAGHYLVWTDCNTIFVGDVEQITTADESLYTKATVSSTGSPPYAGEQPGMAWKINGTTYNITYTVTSGDTTDQAVALGICNAVNSNAALLTALAANHDHNGIGYGHPVQAGCSAQTSGGAILFDQPFGSNNSVTAITSSHYTLAFCSGYDCGSPPGMDGGPFLKLNRSVWGRNQGYPDLGPYISLEQQGTSASSVPYDYQIASLYTLWSGPTSVTLGLNTLQSGGANNVWQAGQGMWMMSGGSPCLGDLGAGWFAACNIFISSSSNQTTTLDISNTSTGGASWSLQVPGSSVSGRTGNLELLKTGGSPVWTVFPSTLHTVVGSNAALSNDQLFGVNGSAFINGDLYANAASIGTPTATTGGILIGSSLTANVADTIGIYQTGHTSVVLSQGQDTTHYDALQINRGHSDGSAAQTLLGFNNTDGGATFLAGVTTGGNATITGASSITGTVAPTMSAGLLALMGNVAPTFGANGEGACWLDGTTGGLACGGQGSTNDFEVKNRNGTLAMSLATGTTNWAMDGSLTLSAASGTTSLNVGTAGTSGGQVTVAGSSSGSQTWVAPAAASGTITFPPGSATLAAAFSGTSGSIGGSALTAGTCSSGAATIAGATTSMVAMVSPNTYPGDGAYWNAYVSSSNTVTVKICAIVALTPTASTYNIRVIQ